MKKSLSLNLRNFYSKQMTLFMTDNSLIDRFRITHFYTTGVAWKNKLGVPVASPGKPGRRPVLEKQMF